MNGPPHSALVVPEPLDEDDDDIRWALHTAAVQWRRGAREDAIAWVRRGADAAVDGGFWERASQLNVAAASLERALYGGTESGAPPLSGAPRSLPRPPTPIASSAIPSSAQAGRSQPLTQSASVKPIQLSKPPSVHVPTLTSTAPNSRWPTGFPKGPAATSTPSGHAIAPPPPLPANVKKAPIPPPPKTKSREAARDDVEIEISEESIDLSDDEQRALSDDGVYGSHPEFAKPAMRATPSSRAVEFNALTRYELDEDPSDGTTSLPLESNYGSSRPTYGSSMPSDSFEGQDLPAFPLEDSMPAGAPSSPPRAPDSLRQNPPPRFGSEPPTSARRTSSVSQRPMRPENLARWASRDDSEESVRPSRGPARSSAAPPTRSELSARPQARAFSEEPTVRGYRMPSGGPSELEEAPDSLLQPLPAPRVPSEAPPARPSRPMEPSSHELEPDALEPIDEDENAPPSTERGLGQLGSVPPPDALPSDPAPMSAAPKKRTTKPPPSQGISVPAPSDSAAPSKSRAKTTQRLVTSELPVSGQYDQRTYSERPSAPRSDIQSELPKVPPLTELPLSEPNSEVVEEAPVSAAPSIRGIAFSDVRGLCDLPEEMQMLLRKRACIERMGTGEDLSFFAVVLVLEGWVKLMPAIADTTCATASAGDVVFTQGTLEDGVALRVVAGQNGTTLATWDKATFTEITEACPWVGDELRLIADSFQALAGTTLGPLGERLDDALREVVTSRCRVLTLLPQELLVARGKPVPGMHIVGGGTVELLDEQNKVIGTCSPGEFLLTAQVLAGGGSPHTVRAGSGGALVLFAPRMDAHELLVSVPPLLEILAG